MSITTTTLAQSPDLWPALDRIDGEAWDEFMLHDEVARTRWGATRGVFASFQTILLDDAGNPFAIGYAAPLSWDGTIDGLPAGWDGALLRACSGVDNAEQPNTLCALAAVIARDQRGDGYSRSLVQAMCATAARQGFGALIAPVRPTWKSRYPLTPIERYAEWRLPDGRRFDPWLRVHESLGATLLRVEPRSMLIEGTVAEWESWTTMVFPDSGPYIVPGALVPITIDRQADAGIYTEPNVWMRHDTIAAREG